MVPFTIFLKWLNQRTENIESRTGKAGIGMDLNIKRQHEGSKCVKATFCILSVSISVSCIAYYTIILQDIPFGESD